MAILVLLAEQRRAAIVRAMPMLTLAALIAAAIGCDGGADNGADAGLECPDGSVEQYGACLFDCPMGWQRNADGFCAPPCLQGWEEIDGACALPCPDGLEPVDGGPLCRPPESEVGPRPCIDEPYDIEGSEDADQIIFVNAATGSAGGDGSEGDPFQTIEQAFGAIEPGAVEVAIALSAGEYVVDDWMTPLLVLPESLHVLGVCADETIVAGPVSMWEIEQAAAALDLARMTISCQINFSELLSLRVRDCLVNGLLNWWTSGTEESVVVERNNFEVPDDFCLALYGGDPVVQVTGNLFGACQGAAIDAAAAADLLVEGNWFVAGDQPAAALATHETSANRPLVFSRNWVVGGSTSAVNLSQWTGPVEVAEVSFSEITGVAIYGQYLENATVRGVRVSTTQGSSSTAAILFTDSVDVAIEECAVVGPVQQGIRLLDSSSVEIVSVHLQSCEQQGLYVSGSAETIIDNSVLRDNGAGLYVTESTVQVTNTSIGANDGVGVKAMETEGLTVDSSVVAGNASTGIDFTFLQGDETSTFAVTGCDVYDNTGLGVLVRSGGPAREVVLTGNRIVGTRPGVVQNAQGQGSVGDGIAVLTGTDGIGSHAVLQGNTVYGNSRLGILLHGTGTTCEANGNVFLAGNGYSGELSSLVSGSPDFLYQQGATVTGSDLSWSQQPSEDIYANPGGGDPRLPSY